MHLKLSKEKKFKDKLRRVPIEEMPVEISFTNDLSAHLRFVHAYLGSNVRVLA